MNSFEVDVDDDGCIGHIDLRGRVADTAFVDGLKNPACVLVEDVLIVEGRDVYVSLPRRSSAQQLADAVRPLVEELKVRQG